MKIAKYLILFIVFFPPLSMVSAFGNGKDVNSFSNPLPQPRLIYPITDEVDLSGKPSLEFRWGEEYAVWVRAYELKLYRGYQTYQANLILKETVNDGGSLKIDAAKFENGQVYTWTLKQVSQDGQKSDASYDSFRVIKK